MRIICATHKNLRDLVDKGAFRQDLYYRLNVIELRMPPARAFGRHRAAGCRRPAPPFWRHAAQIVGGGAQALEFYSFPATCASWKTSWSAPPRCAPATASKSTTCNSGRRKSHDAGIEGRGSETLDEYLNRLERQAILEALQKAEGNRTAAARLLGVTFRSMRYRLERLGIE